MNFSIEKSIEILARTPGVLNTMLLNIYDDWTSSNEGEKTWSVYDIIGHLIHGEKTDWIPRMEIILSDKTQKTFEPFDRFAQNVDSNGKSITQLLEEFTSLRKKNVAYLLSKNINISHLNQKGIHPSLGEVTLSQLIASWVVHDLNHIAQISRVMAKQYKEDVGPWKAYLRILQN